MKKHIAKDAITVLLLFAGICSLLSLVCTTTPELPSGETVGQWIWLGKAVLFSSGCILIASSLQLFGKAYREDALGFPYFYVYVAWSLVLIGAVEAVWGLCQLYGFSVSGHSRYALTGSFFNPGPYGGYLAMVLPVCVHLYLRICGWKGMPARYRIEKGAAAVSGMVERMNVYLNIKMENNSSGKKKKGGVLGCR
ncbi:hypothetical protein [Bacteroides maternus]|uniref:hypothetical protein n=1 Tax=Bacteroides maternus TaxID=3117552 RepID=UPI003CC7AE10